MSPYGIYSPMLLVTVISCFVLTFFSAAINADSTDCDSLECQLISPIRPEEYEVSLKLFIPTDSTNISKEMEFAFKGEVTVDFVVIEATFQLLFHAFKLRFTSVKMACGGSPSFSDVMFTVGISTMTVHLAEELGAGSQCSLKFSYNGLISDYRNGGLVKESIIVDEGIERWIVFTGYKLFTAMPPTVFPCIDEPSYKANFSLKLLHPSGLVAIASTPLREANKTENGWTYSVFEKMEEVSTFGVSFAVGHFKKIATQTTPKRTINTWIPCDTESIKLVDSNAVATYIEELENYLDVDYPSPKLDFVALPQYEDNSLYCSSFRAPTLGIVFLGYEWAASLAKVRMAIARGWFGVLTTPKWWDDGFLIEGFAAYFYFLGDHLSEIEQIDNTQQLFVNEELFFDLHLASSSMERHPIIKHEPSCFTREMGLKSAFILQMVQRIVGEENFRFSIQKFLKAHLHGVVTHNDLFEIFTESMRESKSKDWCGRPLNARVFLSPWLTQKGYPDVLMSSDANDGIIFLSQTSLRKQDTMSTWPIPVFIGNNSLNWIPPANAQCKVSPSLILTGTERKLLRPSSLIYSVFVYDEYERTRIINMFSPDSAEKLSDADKMAFLIHHLYCDPKDCSKKLAENKADIVKVVAKIIENSKSAVILNMVEGTLSMVRSLFLDTPQYSLWKEFGKSLFGQNFSNASLTTNLNSSATSFMRAVLGYAIEFDVSDVRRQSFELFKTAYEQCNSNKTAECEQLPLNPAYISDILCGAVKHDPAYTFSRLLEHARNFRLMFPDSFQQQEELYCGLSCVENEAMLKEYIREVLRILHGPYKLHQLSYDPLLRLKNSQLAADVMASYLVENILEIANHSLFGHYARTMIQNWNSPERYDQLTKIGLALNSLSINGYVQREFDFDIWVMKQVVENNVRERALYLEPLASYFRHYLLKLA